MIRARGRSSQSFNRIGKPLVAGAMLLLLCVNLSEKAEAQDAHKHHQHAPPESKKVEEVSAGNMSISDVVLINQLGERVHVYDDLIKGKVVAINTIFTTCTTICPPMGVNFSRLQKLMGDRASKDFNLISISVDPLIDTPQRLKAWSEKFGAEPGWTLLTGPKHEVDKLLKTLKVFTADKWEHTPIILVGNEATGEWVRANGLAPSTKLVEVIEGVIKSAPKKSPPKEDERR